MKLSRRVKIVLIGVVVCAGLLGTACGGLYGWIQWDAHQKAKAVLAAYPQASDEVEALLLRMESPDCTLKQRNQAVWILGRLADERALARLVQVYTGQPCEHDKFLCQYELEKAICRCGGYVEKRNETGHP